MSRLPLLSKTLFRSSFFPPSSSSEQLSLQDNGQALGSLFAHNTLKDLNDRISDYPALAQEVQKMKAEKHFSLPMGSHKNSLDFGHREIDRRFSTNYAPLYKAPGKETNFNTFAYQMRGEKALSQGYFPQAVHDFSKAIELGAPTPLPYLERGVAHFRLGQYDKSLKDYHTYTSQTQKAPLFIPDFSLGFAKGLPRGIYDSGEGLFLLVSDLVTRPVQTGDQMWEALKVLGNLARTEQWSVLSEALAPEVHKLVKEWDTLPSSEKGELAGYAFGKYGADILIPGAVAKATAKGLKAAQELNIVYRSLQTAEKALLLESVASLETGAKVAEVVEASRSTLTLGKELGFSAREMAQLKQAGKLETTVTNSYKHLSLSMQESIALYKKAQDALKPYAKKTMPEFKVRELIHETGIPTFPRPKGIPENFLVMVSDRGAGMEYVHPTNTHVRVRVMPGKPHSLNPTQQKPYVIQQKSGQAFDRHGNFIQPEKPEAHIPFEEFIYRE